MKRTISRLASAVFIAAFALGGLAQPVGATDFECTDDPVPGAVIEGGQPTTQVVQTSYAIQSGGVQVSANVPGVGTFYVEADTSEVGFALTSAGGSLLVGAGVDINGGLAANGDDFTTAVCVVVPGVPVQLYVDVEDHDPARPGVALSVFSCSYTTHACAPLLRDTGIELTVLNPLTSCIYIDGINRNSSGVGC